VRKIKSSKSNALFLRKAASYPSKREAYFSSIKVLARALAFSGLTSSFFQLLITALVALGVNCLGSIFCSFITSFKSFVLSSVSKILNPGSTPMCCPSERSIFSPVAWKVPIQNGARASPTSWDTRSRISLAALLVNVKAIIWDGCALFSDNSQATLVVKTLVLPLPAPATTKIGPSGAVTAACCSLFSKLMKSFKGAPKGRGNKLSAYNGSVMKMPQWRSWNTTHY